MQVHLKEVSEASDILPEELKGIIEPETFLNEHFPGVEVRFYPVGIAIGASFLWYPSQTDQVYSALFVENLRKQTAISESKVA